MLRNELTAGFKAMASRVLLAMAAIGAAPAQTPFMISNVNSKLVLDDPDFSKKSGEVIQQYTPNAGTNQQWTLHRHGAG